MLAAVNHKTRFYHDVSCTIQREKCVRACILLNVVIQ